MQLLAPCPPWGAVSLIFYGGEMEEVMGRKVTMPTRDEIERMATEYVDKFGVKPGFSDLVKEYGIPSTHRLYTIYLGLSGTAIIEQMNFPMKRKGTKKRVHNEEKIIEQYRNLSQRLGRAASWTDIAEARKGDNTFPTTTTVKKYCGDICNLAKICGLDAENLGAGYDDEYLLKELRRFYVEFGRIPLQIDLENCDTYPTRKTFTGHFGTWNNALRLAGFDVLDKPDFTDKDYLLSEINRYYQEFGKYPTSHDMDSTKGYPHKKTYTTAFGSWRNALKLLDIPTNARHTNEDLESAFHDFVAKYGRMPSITDFNTSEYPSFWCYQSRWGSWAKATEAFGYTPNIGCVVARYELDDEVCGSRYEHGVSVWLRDQGIKYDRNVPYKELIDGYKGRRNCDYRIHYGNKIVLLEIAGLITKNKKHSSMEKAYAEKFKQKQKLIKSGGLDVKVLYPWDFESPVDEIMSALLEEGEEWLNAATL